MLGGSTNTSREQEGKEVYAWWWFNNQSINQIINLGGKLAPFVIFI